MRVESGRDVEDLELEEVGDSQNASKGDSLLKRDNAIIGHIEANAEVIVGTAKISVNELFSLKSGSVVELNEAVNTDAILLIEGKSVAKGKLVAVGEKFGLEITEIL